ncbi:hypothetical protein [Lederbergia graminis]|uniref:Uncharacterized protein n=1 Tax=Lederbergia graminis TaxID=735518 RepID=A0ABW0LMA0_9BACI
MSEFESYSFSRLFSNKYIEFFFIQGINNSDNFDEYWDGRSIEVIGYVVIYNNPEKMEKRNLIYVINKCNRNFDNIIKYTKKFVEQMDISEDYFESDSFEINKTDIKGSLVLKPYTEFIKSVIENDIPTSVLDVL